MRRGAQKLTATLVKKAPAPKARTDKKGRVRQTRKLYFDSVTHGFALLVSSTGSRSFVLIYRLEGRERRYSIGMHPDWSLEAAREKAVELKQQIAQGEDPLTERQEGRDAPTVADLAAIYVEEHHPKLRPSSRRNERSLLDKWILPAIGRKKLVHVDQDDVRKLHKKIGEEAPYRANRMLALLRSMFNRALERRAWVKKEWVDGNPTLGVRMFPEEPRRRMLSPAEIGRLTQAIDAHSNQETGDVIRLILLTGARKSEALKLRWEDLDLEKGIWTKPSHHTKQKRTEHIPLSPGARQLLDRRREAAEEDAEWVFPGRVPGKPLQEIKRFWDQVRKAADLEDMRIHDLRRTHGSLLVSMGYSLPLVGRILGHTQPSTTAEHYAHLLDDPLREATTRLGELMEKIQSGETAEIRPFRRK